MSDKSERLFAAMSQLSDQTIDEGAAFTPGRHAPWKRWAALAAGLCLLAAGAAGLLPRLGGSGGGGLHGEAGVFQSYAGPVFPLTLREENASVTARRAITLDFAPWEPVWQSNEAELAEKDGLTDEERRQAAADLAELFPEGGYWRTSSDILVTDQYTLTNASDTDQTVWALYPFVCSLQSLEVRRPTLAVDGRAREARLHVGGYSGGFTGAWTGGGTTEAGSVNLAPPACWADYQALLADGRYQADALGDGPDVGQVPVVVYKLTEPYGPAADEAAGVPNPTLRATFRLDYGQTRVLTYGFHGGSAGQEEGVMIQDFSIPQPGEADYGAKTCYLLVVGEDIRDLTLQGYADGSLAPDAAPLAGCGATVERYESDLGTMLREILPRIRQERLEGEAGDVDFEIYYRAFVEQLLAYGVLSSEGAEMYGSGWLEEIDASLQALPRVCWLETEVTIPAGGSVTLTASLQKEASYDHYGSGGENGVRGYDLVTALGSNLVCPVQTATLEDRGQIQILGQNFGFDLESGLRTVELEAGVERYYLEVKRRAGTIPRGAPEDE